MNAAEDDKSAWRQTPNGMAYLPAPNQLWSRAEAPLRTCYSVLGVPLEVATNAPALQAAAKETFGDGGEPDAVSPGTSMQLRVYLHEVSDAGGAEGLPTPLLMRVQQDYFFLSEGNSFGFGDRASGFAAAFVTPETAANRLLTQIYFLECLGMYIVCRERPIMLHAAALIHRDRCLLLAGADGVGKSTLTYACLRAGFRLLAEDVVFAAKAETPLEVWGNPWYLHLLPDAPRLFPELSNREPTRMLNGETKLRLKVKELFPGAAVPHSRVWGVCALSRTPGAQTYLRPADKDYLHRMLTTFQGDPPMDRAAQEQAVECLAAGRTWHLEIGSGLDEAVAALSRLLEAA